MDLHYDMEALSALEDSDLENIAHRHHTNIDEDAAALALYEACSSSFSSCTTSLTLSNPSAGSTISITPPSSTCSSYEEGNKNDTTAGAQISDIIDSKDQDDFGNDDQSCYEPIDAELGLLPEQYEAVLSAVYGERYGDEAMGRKLRKRWEDMLRRERGQAECGAISEKGKKKELWLRVRMGKF
jgi:hypothetical protein